MEQIGAPSMAPLSPSRYDSGELRQSPPLPPPMPMLPPQQNCYQFTLPPPMHYPPTMMHLPPPASPNHYHHHHLLPPAYGVPMFRERPGHFYPEHERAWSTGIFDCTYDIQNSLSTVFCPCITFGQNVEIINEGQTPWYEPGTLCAFLAAVSCLSILILHLSFWYTFAYRKKLRQRYKLKGNTCEDCMVHCFCQWCALCQEYRELDHQGFNVPLGWDENKRRERQAVAIFRLVPPEQEQGMIR